jgi:7-cyano-7-deazaguanine reductase
MVGDKSVLETFEAPTTEGRQVHTFESDELTAKCPFDFGGPDYYSITIRYIPESRCIESRSLKEHLESLRDVEITAERLGAHFHDILVELLEPQELYVRLEQARRGGIEETIEVGDTVLRRD